MGNTCKPMAVSFQCMTKFTTKKKKKKNRDLSNTMCLKADQKHKGEASSDVGSSFMKKNKKQKTTTLPPKPNLHKAGPGTET